jgi:autotransporter-associated beta strand protein
MTVGDPATAFFGYTFNANGQGGQLTFDASAGDANLTFTAAQGTTVNTFNVPLRLNDTLQIHALNTGQHVFNGNITGSGGLVIDSSGTHGSGTSSLVGQVSLTGVNTFTGGLTITGARVSVAAPNSLGTGAVTVNDGGAVLLSSSGIYSNNFVLSGLGWNEPTQLQLGAIRSEGNSTLTGSITLASSSRLAGTANTTIVNGVIGESASGSGLEINRLQSGGAATNSTWVFNNTNTYTGKTTVNSGTLRIGNGGTTGSLGTTSGLEFANATVEFRRSDNFTVTTPFTQLTGTIGGVAVTGSNFAHSGAGVLTLDNGASAYTGTTTVSGTNGKLVFGTGGAYNFAGTGAITLSNGADIEFNTSSAVNLGSITGSVNSYVIQSGIGTTTLGGAADNSQTWATVNAGTLVLGKASTSAIHSVGANNNLALVVNGGTARLAGSGGDQIFTESDVKINGGTLDLNGASEGFDVLSGNSGTVTNGAAASAGTLTLGENNSGVNLVSPIAYNTTFGGVIENGAGTVALTKTGTGLQTLSGANTYTGATTINGGVLSITGSLASTGAVAVNTGGTLSGTGSVGNVTLENGGSIRPGATNLDTSIGSLTLKSLAVNGGDIRMNLGATSDAVTVTGAANFAGAATITPTFSAPPTMGTTTLVNATGGLTVGASPILNGIPGITRSTFVLDASANKLDLIIGGASAKSLTWTGATSAAWDLNTTANFSGPGPETYYDLDAVTFGDQPFNRSVTLAAGLTPTSVTVNNSAGNDYIFQTGSIAGAGSLTKSGNGTLTLNTANTFSGPVNITGGSLKAGNAAALGDANGQTFVSGGGTLDVNGLNLGAEVINISGTGVGGSGVLINSGGQQFNATRFITLTGNATIGTAGNRFDIRANGGGENLDLAGFTLTKVGSGTFGIVNANVTSGNIVVNQGGLQIEGGSGIVQGTGTITYNSGTNAVFYQSVAGNVTRPMVWNGITVDTLAQNSGVGSNITLGGDATFVATGNTLTLTCNISETGGARSLIKNNGGTLALNGNNTFTGGITSTAGTINLSGTNAIAGPVNLTNTTLQVLATPTTNAILGTPSSISLNASNLRLNLLENATLPATTLAPNTNNNLNFNGQTQASTLTLNSAIGSTTGFNSFSVEQGTAVLASGSNLTVAQANVGLTAGNSGNLGTLNIQPGASLTTRTLYIGEGAGGRSGIVNQGGGTVNVLGADLGNDGSLRIGHWNGSGSTYNLSNGTLNVPNGTTSVGVDGANPSLNISGGTANLYRLLVDGRTGTGPIGGTLNVSGGELAIGAGGLGNTGNGQTNLSGGTLSASAASAWSAGLNFVNNSPTLDTRENAVTLSGVLVGPGGFTKTGSGRLTLSHASSLLGGAINANAGETYVTGGLLNTATNVTVNSGATLLLDGTGTNTGVINGTVNVNNGGLLYGAGNGSTTGKVGTVNIAAGADVRPGLGIGTLSANAFNMNGGVARFELNGTTTTTGAGVNDLVAVTSGLTFTGGTIVPSFTSAPASGNVYTIFTSGTLTGLPTVDASAANSRLTYGIAAAGNNVTLSVTGATKALTWTGASNGTWDVNSAQNWNDGAAAEKFFQADSVTFNGSAPGTVTLVGSIQPVSTTVNAAVNYAFTGGSIDTGSLTKSGTGTLSLLSSNGYSGGTTIDGGVLSFANGALGTGPITMNGGTLQWNGTNTQDVSNRIAMVAAKTATFDTNGNSITLAGALGNSTTGPLTKIGGGTLALTGANTYTGATTVSEGTLSIGNGATAGSLAGGSAVSVANGATVKWNNAFSTGIVTIANSISGPGNLLLQGQNSTNGLQLGLYDLTGNNSSFSGTLQVNRAILTNVASQAELGSATIELQDRGTIFITTAGTYTSNFIVGQDAGWHHNVGGGDLVLGAIRLQGTNTLSGNIVLNNTASVVLGDPTGANSTIGAYTTSDNLLTGVISGPGDFAMSRYTGWNGGTQQAAIIRLGGSSSNTYTGKTVVDGQGSSTAQASLWLEKTGGAVAIPANTVVQMGSGTSGQFNLRMGQNEQFGSGVVMNWVNASGQWGRFDLKGTTQTLAGVNSGTATVQGNGIIQNQGIDGVAPSGPGTITLNGSDTYLFNGNIRDRDSGAGAPVLNLVKSGSGTQILVGNQIAYTGNTTVSGGTLRLENTTAFNSSIDNNATVEIFAPTGSNYLLGNGKTYSGSGTWIKSGDGRVRLGNGIVNATGNIMVQGGILANDNNSANWSGSSVNVDVSPGATFDIRADSVRLNALTGAGTVNNSFGNGNGAFDTLTVGVSGGSAVFNGQIIDGGASTGENRGGTAFTKEGAGTQTLTGNNTYSGPTTISGGTLQVGNGGATGNIGTNAITNNGSLIFNRSNNHTVNNPVSGTGSLTKAGAGTMVLNSSNTYTGATIISDGTLQLGASTALPVSAGIWLDATDGQTVNTSGGGVVSWTNKGSLGTLGNAVAPSGSEPTFVALEAGMNNQPVIHFDASASGGGPFDQLTNGLNFSGSDVTVMYAGRLTGGANFRLLAGASNNWLLGTHGGLSDRGHLGVSSAFVDQGGVAANTNPHVYTGTNSTGGTAAFYTDGVLRGVNTSTNYTGPNGLSLGGGFSSGGLATTEFSDGDIGELLVFTNVLSENDRRSVEAYLSRKWKGVGSTDVLPTGTAVSLTANGATLDVNGVTQTVGSISGVAGTSIKLGGGALTTGTDNTSTSFNGALSGQGTLHKVGAGAWTLGGANANTGNVFVDEGTLVVSGSLSGSSVTVANGATLGGGGTIGGNITALTGATISLGSSPGQLDTGSFTLNTGAMLKLEIGGTGAGTTYDQLDVTGGVTLGGDLSLMVVNGFVPQLGQQFWVTLNDGSDSVTGIFANVPITDVLNNSGAFMSGGLEWKVYYGADFTSGAITGGNDILVMVPEPNALIGLVGGLGLLIGLRRRRSAQL